MDDVELLNEFETWNLTKRSVSTLRSERRQGVGIPFVKINRTVLYRKQDVLDYINRHVVQTMNPSDTTRDRNDKRQRHEGK
jgi:hypothetical protein